MMDGGGWSDTSGRGSFRCQEDAPKLYGSNDVLTRCMTFRHYVYTSHGIDDEVYVLYTN